jgi:FtsZ-interacting cell division protein YlmF
MCFDLIKEGIVDKVRWFANKIGIVADDDGQIDEDRTRYANFEYDTSNQPQQQQRENSGKRSFTRGKSNDSYGEPPAYDYESANENWLKNIRDKGEPSSNIIRKKGVTIKDEKH